MSGNRRHDVVRTTYGEALSIELTWTNHDRTAVDLSDATLSISEASPESLKSMTLEKTDAVNGKFVVRSTIVQAKALSRSRDEFEEPTAFFAVQALFAPDRNRVTPKIFVSVK